MGAKTGITYLIPHNYVKMKVNTCNSLPLAETLTFHNVIKHIKSIWVKDKNNYYYNIFLEKCLYELPKNNDKL